MKNILVFLFGRDDEDERADWTITRLRAIQDKPIGPRYPTGLFTLYDPRDERVSHA